MIKLFDFIPSWLWAAVVAGLITTNLIGNARLSAERLAHQTTKTVYAEQVSAAEKARADEEAKRRKVEQELTNAQAKHATEVEALRRDSNRARTAAAAAADSLRSATTAAAQRARAQCANSTATGVRETADDPIGVLTYVLGRADARAGELADLAEQRGIAGRACEREYDAAREALIRLSAEIVPQ